MSVDTVLNKLKTIIASGDNYYRANNFSQAKMCYQQALAANNPVYKSVLPTYENQLKMQIEECDKGRIPAAAPVGGGGGGNGYGQGGNGGGSANAQSDELEGMEKQLESQMTKVEGLTWSSVAGLKEAINSLTEAIELPRKYPHLFTGDRKPWSGILLYGPPGTGKSYLAKVVASEIQGSFFSISSSDLVSKWQGESEKLIRSLFSLARKKAPSVIFIDEIDSIATARTEGENEASRRIKTQLLVQMQGVTTDSDINHRVLVLGATNVPWEIDSAARRRFEKRIYIPLPDPEARRELFNIQLKKMWHNLSPPQIEELVQNTEGFSGSDIATMCKEAAMQPVKRVSTSRFYRLVNIQNQRVYLPCGNEGGQYTYDNIPENERNRIYDFVSFGDFTNALNRARRTVSQDDLRRFEEWTAEFGIQG